ncbi:hypothetical protein [Bacillus vallismortis]|uniref:hypothetical protein n=1 Tax=Bacillus vallismortis TaxID=72361 RepID=UPI00227F8A97|nr:hypothetical protein [Bacillus vallismortis]MCY8545375.1 hypothetical protein [Bacillus vallismortis]
MEGFFDGMKGCDQLPSFKPHSSNAKSPNKRAVIYRIASSSSHFFSVIKLEQIRMQRMKESMLDKLIGMKMKKGG